MTRDEQIAQLKPGDTIGLRDYGLYFVFVAHVGDEYLLAAQAGRHAVLYRRELVIIPEPPPKPKAVPGVRYRTANIVSAANPGGGGSIDYHYIGVGLINGDVYHTAFAREFQFDPAVWTPIDDVKVGE